MDEKRGGACLLAVMMMLPLMPATDVHAEAKRIQIKSG